MNRTKAQFRAIRERIGLSQKTLADALGNNVDTVKRWENPKYYAIPDDAWKYIDGLLQQHIVAVQSAMETIEGNIEREGHAPTDVTLLYYRSQRHYDMYGRDKGDYQLVNARTREIAALLEDEGIHTVFKYPEDDELMFQQLANTRQ